MQAALAVIVAFKPTVKTCSAVLRDPRVPAMQAAGAIVHPFLQHQDFAEHCQSQEAVQSVSLLSLLCRLVVSCSARRNARALTTTVCFPHLLSAFCAGCCGRNGISTASSPCYCGSAQLGLHH